jgi:ribosomal protein S18 acetylase RimI-like enzyme
MTVQIRSFNENDLSILVKSLNETYQGSYEFIPYTEDRLRKWIQDGKLEVLMAESDGKVVGSAAYRDGHWGEEIDWLAVSESRVRKLVESLLVKEIEKHVKRETVFTAVDAGSPEIDRWVGFGYRAEGGLYHMIARLDGRKPLPDAPEGIIIRSLRANEEKALVETVNAGFGWERLKTGIIQEWKDDCPSFTEEWVHVAESGSRLVSVVASRPDSNYNKNFEGKRGYLGPAATLPEFRGKKIASILTLRAMNLLFERGLNSVVLYTAEQNVASTTLLRKLGFEISHHWKFMRKNFDYAKNTPSSKEKTACSDKF